MDRGLERELKLIKTDKEIIDSSLVSNQISYANMLKNGLGEKIKNDLTKDRTKITYRFMHIIKKIFNTL